MIQIPTDFIPASARVAGPTLDDKRRAAIAWLGTRWVLHPANAPRKLRRPYGDGKAVRS